MPLDARSENLVRAVHNLPNAEAWALICDSLTAWGIDRAKHDFMRRFLWDRRRELNKLQVSLAVKRRRWYVVWDDGVQEFVSEHISRAQAARNFEFYCHIGSCVVQLRDPSYRILKSIRQDDCDDN